MAYYYRRGGFFSNIPAFTRKIIIANILVWIACVINEQRMMLYFALYPVSTGMFHIWQPFTYMFMHGGFWHLFFNMWALMIFGSALERVWGARKLSRFYFITGVCAAIFHMALEFILKGGATACLVGASGAVYGLLLGYAMLYPESRLMLIFPPVSFSAKTMAIVFVVIEIVMGVLASGDHVAHFAHLGGMLAGYVIILIWKKKHILYDREGGDED